MNNAIPISGQDRLHPVFTGILKNFGYVNTHQVEENVIIDSYDVATDKKNAVISWHWSYEEATLQQRTVVSLMEWNNQCIAEKQLHPGSSASKCAAMYFLMREEIIPYSPEYVREVDYKS